MRIVIITQSDPFFLAENINYLANKLPEHSEIVAAVVFEASPFASKEKTLMDKIKKTVSIFGLNFFLRYGFLFMLNKLNPNKNVTNVLKKHNIPNVKLAHRINHPDSLDKIRSFNPDLLISIAGNQIFRQPLLDIAPKGCLNLHSALLPKYRGLFPSFWVLKNNEKETGVSVFFVDEGIDSGPIIVQKKIPISENMTHRQLIKISKKTGMDAILESIELINLGNYECLPNPEAEMTYFSFPSKEDVTEFYRNGKKFY